MRLLLVDDDISSMSALTNLLQHDYKLEMASNGADALKIFKKEHIDVVITDINMTKMTGVELLRSIRERSHNAYVIVVTGYPSNDNIQDADRYGAYAFFTKPIDVERFMRSLCDIEQRLHYSNGQDHFQS